MRQDSGNADQSVILEEKHFLSCAAGHSLRWLLC